MNDEPFYDVVATEIQHGHLKPGLWTKAFADANGDQTQARVIYIRLRVAQLQQDAIESARTRQEAERAQREAPKLFRKAVLGESPVTCPHCGHCAQANKTERGNSFLCLLLLLACIIPGLIYALLNSGFRYACPKCGATYFDK